MFKHHFLKSGLAALFLCGLAQTAAAATLQKPTEGWRVKPISAKQGDEPAYCAMKNSFKGGTAMIVARETTGDNAIALDFHKNKFKPGIRYNVKAQAGAATRDVEALAASKQVLILQMGADPEFFSALAQAHSATFTAGKNTYGFDLDVSAADALTALGHCAASLKVGMTFTEAAFSLGVSNEKSAKKVAEKTESIDAPLDTAVAKPAASDITARTAVPESIDAQPDSNTAASKATTESPVTEVSALNAKPVVTDITPTEKTAENKAPEKAVQEKAPEKTKVSKAPKSDSNKPGSDKVADVKTANDKAESEKAAAEKTAATEGDKIADHVEKIAKGEMAYDIPADERPAPSKKRRNKQAKKSIIEDILPSSSAQPYVQVTREPQPPSEQMVDMVRDDIKTEIASELLVLSGAKPLAPLPAESGPSVSSLPVPPVEASAITSAKKAPEIKPATEEPKTAAFTAPTTGDGFSMDAPAAPSSAVAKTEKQKRQAPDNMSKLSSQADPSSLTQLQEEAIAGLRAAVALKEAQIGRMQTELHGKTDEMQTVLMEKEKSLAAAELAISNNNKALAEAHAIISNLKSQNAALLQEKEPAAGGLQQQEMTADAPAAYHAPQQHSRPGSFDLKGLLMSSRELTDNQIKISDNGNALHWASGGLFGSAQKSPNADKSLQEAADDYLRKTASLCKGDFGHKLSPVEGDGKLNMLEADITCVDGQHNAAAAVLFISSKDMFSVITEEGTVEQLHTAMSNRDAFVSAALGNAAPAGGISVNFGGQPQRKLPPLVAETVSH